MSEEERTKEARWRLVEQEIAPRIENQRIVGAFLKVPRHEFVSSQLKDQAYENHPLPIGFDQTISQPFVVALMLELLAPQAGDKVLEIGTGCGYQTALLAELAKEVYSIEIIPELHDQAKTHLAKLGCRNVQLKVGDGAQGWSSEAPFDCVIVSAASPQVPRELIHQLKIGGRMVVPLGEPEQELVLLEKRDGEIEETLAGAVRFVPMTGSIRESK